MTDMELKMDALILQLRAELRIQETIEHENRAFRPVVVGSLAANEESVYTQAGETTEPPSSGSAPNARED